MQVSTKRTCQHLTHAMPSMSATEIGVDWQFLKTMAVYQK